MSRGMTTLGGTALLGLWVWMLLMTSVWFHNPPEKLTGLGEWFLRLFHERLSRTSTIFLHWAMSPPPHSSLLTPTPSFLPIPFPTTLNPTGPSPFYAMSSIASWSLLYLRYAASSPPLLRPALTLYPSSRRSRRFLTDRPRCVIATLPTGSPLPLHQPHPRL